MSKSKRATLKSIRPGQTLYYRATRPEDLTSYVGKIFVKSDSSERPELGIAYSGYPLSYVKQYINLFDLYHSKRKVVSIVKELNAMRQKHRALS
jgi:hypothetical protein